VFRIISNTRQASSIRKTKAGASNSGLQAAAIIPLAVANWSRQSQNLWHATCRLS